MIWREKQVLLGILAVLLLANLVYFFTYRVQFQARLAEYSDRAHQAEAQLETARSARIASERQLAGYRKVQKDIQDVFNIRWSTQAVRLAPMITEVKKLAVVSQLVPQTYSFTNTTGTDKTGALGASVVGINFTVQGTYPQVRRLINLLELSQQFVIVDQVSLNGGESILTMNLHLKTLFRTPEAAAGNRPSNRTS